MSNQEFENYLSLIGKLLQLTRDQRNQIAGELRDHLELRVADLVNEGVTNRDAIAQALEEFGDATVMARNFQTVLNHKRRRWIMRFATFSIAASFLAAILVMAMWPDDANFGTPAASLAQEPKTETVNQEKPGVFKLSRTTERNLETERILRQDASLEYDADAISDIMAELAEKNGISFILDESAVDDGLPPDEAISFQLANVSLGKALEFMLKPHNATYIVDEGVVVIISMDNAEDPENMRVRMYNCQDLLDALPESNQLLSLLSKKSDGGFGNSNASTLRTRKFSGGGKFGGGAGGPGMGSGLNKLAGMGNSDSPVRGKFSGGAGSGMGMGAGMSATSSAQQATASTDSPTEKRETTKEEKLLEIICSMVESDSWERYGTGIGKADMFNGVLIVKAHQKVFREIDNLLIDLRGHVLAQ